ncbi:hypothetical protein CVT24_002061 [Panaeolus cyanescens]|uniref:DUF4187 domain-containing protein n=1 Tax=Panaeolus cyanescens TaxID=181874 RepID=A0A409W1H4_9AGAR|nr:hypothetical protein CVT24_002061 [Panaeolus cyanescens]
MSDDDDDYLSDKFLLQTESTSKKPSTYSELRKEAQKRSHLKNEENKKKSRRQLEMESREAGLSKSLFERAKEEEEAGLTASNKALSIMMKMGFKPGQSLGSHSEEPLSNAGDPAPASASTIGTSTVGDTTPEVQIPQEKVPLSSTSATVVQTTTHTSHRSEPLPLLEWAGRRGIGLGVKRERSPGMVERMAKMARMEEQVDHRDFRDRVRDEYNNRRAEGRLGKLLELPGRYLNSHNEKDNIQFNVLWLNPNNVNTFPSGLIDALTLHSNAPVVQEKGEETVQARLKKQMQADALLPVDTDSIGEESNAGNGFAGRKPSSTVAAEDEYSSDLLEEAAQFLRLQAQDRLHLVLSYLREKHSYCFWCGVQYESRDELKSQCPGAEEDDHD